MEEMDSAGCRLLGLLSLSETTIRVNVVRGKGDMLARTLHPMPTYLLYPEENQSTRSSSNARRNKTPNRDAETSKEKLNKETECE